ncbi:hypothetical protein [Streptomyces sp. NBC_01236]|nr:hypothetical protein OG324_08970 [Streptomyces sp. NBC_01236]
MSGVEVLAAVVAAYYGGRMRQWWLSRHDRKTAGAIAHLINKATEKEG